MAPESEGVASEQEARPAPRRSMDCFALSMTIVSPAHSDSRRDSMTHFSTVFSSAPASLARARNASDAASLFRTPVERVTPDLPQSSFSLRTVSSLSTANRARTPLHSEWVGLRSSSPFPRREDRVFLLDVADEEPSSLRMTLRWLRYRSFRDRAPRSRAASSQAASAGATSARFACDRDSPGRPHLRTILISLASFTDFMSLVVRPF